MHLTPIDDLSILGILVGAVLHFVLGAAWYSPALFSKQWMAALGKSTESSPGMPLAGMGANGIGALVSTAVVGILYLWGGGDGALDGIVAGLLVGVGVVAMENLNRPFYEGAPWALYAINSGYAVAGFALAGLGYAIIA